MVRYKLKAAVFNRLKLNHGEHIPYLIGTVVEGPRGGTYMLDEFCSEHFCRKINNDYIKTGAFVKQLAIKGVIAMCEVNKPDFSSDRDIGKLAKEFKCTKALKRISGMREIDSWG